MDTIDGMRTFITVVSQGSFSAAAERLGMSPQLVSKYVGQLEERFGVQLLNRTTRSLNLTEDGQALYDRGTTLLEDFEALEGTIKARDGRPKGKLAVSAPVTFGESYLTRAIVDFGKEHSEVSVDLRLTDRVVNLVDEGFDVALRIGNLEDSSLIARRLGRVQLLPCASPAYLLENGFPNNPSELSHHECVVDLNQRTPYRWSYQREGGEHTSVTVSGRIAVNSARAAGHMAISGVGIALCPDFAVSDDILEGRLEVLFENYNFSTRGIYAVYPHNRHLAVKVRVFVDFLAEQLQIMFKRAELRHRET